MGDNHMDNDLLPTKKSRMHSVSKPTPTSRKYSSAPNPPKVYQVNAFKMIQGQYQLQGKHGLALLSNLPKRDFKIIVYANGNITLSQTQVTPNFSVEIARGGYASLKDSQNNSWSLLFDSTSEMEDFVRRVLVFQFYTGNEAEIISLTIERGSSSDHTCLTTGDTCDVAYTSWLVNQGAPGNVIEEILSTSPLTVQMGSGKAMPGLQEALLGMKTGSRKCIIIPSNKACGASSVDKRASSDLPILLDVTVVRTVKHHSNIHFSKPLREDLDEAPLPIIPQTYTSSDSEEGSTSRKRSSTSHHKHKQSKTTPTKQDLISRMAKIGSSLPKKLSDVSSESEKESLDKSTSKQKNYKNVETELYPKKSSQIQENQSVPAAPSYEEHSSENPIRRLGYQQPQQQFPSNYEIIHPQQKFSSQIVPYGVQQQTPFPPGLMSGLATMYAPHFPSTQTGFQNQPNTSQPNTTISGDEEKSIHSAMLVTETRQQNVEMRMAVSKLQDKVDKIFERIIEDRNTRSTGGSGQLVPSMDTTLLLQNLTRIIGENEQLKREVFAKGETIEKEKKKMAEILAEHHSFLEQRNVTMEQSNDSFKSLAMSSQAKVLTLEEEKLKVVQDLSARTAEIFELKVEQSKQKKEETELRSRLASALKRLNPLEHELGSLQDSKIQLEEMLSTGENREKAERQRSSATQIKLVALEEQLADTLEQLKTIEKSGKEIIEKLKTENIKLKEDMENMSTQSEKQLVTLKEKLRNENDILLSSANTKQASLEQEITDYWKKRCIQQVDAEKERASRERNDLEEDKDRSEAESRALQTKLIQFKEQTRSLKENYKMEIQKLGDQVESLENDLSEQKATLDNELVASKVKVIMNEMFKAVKSKLIDEKRYSGKRFQRILIATIRRTTLRLTNPDYVSDSESESDEIEEEEEEVKKLSITVEKKEASCQINEKNEILSKSLNQPANGDGNDFNFQESVNTVNSTLSSDYERNKPSQTAHSEVLNSENIDGTNVDSSNNDNKDYSPDSSTKFPYSPSMISLNDKNKDDESNDLSMNTGDMNNSSVDVLKNSPIIKSENPPLSAATSTTQDDQEHISGIPKSDNEGCDEENVLVNATNANEETHLKSMENGESISEQESGIVLHNISSDVQNIEKLENVDKISVEANPPEFINDIGKEFINKTSVTEIEINEQKSVAAVETEDLTPKQGDIVATVELSEEREDSVGLIGASIDVKKGNFVSEVPPSVNQTLKSTIVPESNDSKHDPLFDSLDDDFLGGFMKKDKSVLSNVEIEEPRATPPPKPLFDVSDDEDDMGWFK